MGASVAGERVSVLIPHYGDPAPTAALVQLLAGETSLHLHEVIVCDDESPLPLPGLRGATVLRRPVNGGFGAAVNTAARAAVGDLLLILNSDVKPEPGFVDALVEAARPWQPAVAAPAIRSAGQSQDTGRDDPRARHVALEHLGLAGRRLPRRLLERAVGVDPAPAGALAHPVEWVAGVAMLVPAEAFRRIGGFDERFFMYCEETDLQVRLRTLGLRSVLLPSITLEHVGEASSDPSRVPRWLAQSRLVQADKQGHLARHRTLLTLVACVNLADATLRCAAGTPVHPLTGFMDEVRSAWAPVPPRR